MTYYRVILCAGGSVVADAATARRLIQQGKAVSVKAIGRSSPLYRKRDMQPATSVNYLMK